MYNFTFVFSCIYSFNKNGSDTNLPEIIPENNIILYVIIIPMLIARKQTD